MRIAVTAPFFVPAVRAGGPIPGIVGAIQTLAGHDVWVFTGDRDLGDDASYPPPYVGTTRVAGTKVSYLPSISPRSLRRWIPALRAIRHSDATYVNSCFSASFTLVPLLALGLLRYSGRVVISPRGELAESATQLGRSALKRGWLWLFRTLGMHRSVGVRDNVVWLASSEREAMDIRRCFQGPRVVVSAERLRPWDGPFAQAVDPDSRPLTIVSVGRIAPIKGTLELVRAAARMRQPARLQLIGLLEVPEYVAEVEDAVANCPDHVRVELVGPLPPDQVRSALLNADLFVSLTHGENFGHAIGEALQTGVPVMISDQTPWSFVADTGAGIVLTPAQCADAAHVAAELDRFASNDLHSRLHRAAAAVRSARLLGETTGQTTLLDALRVVEGS